MPATHRVIAPLRLHSRRVTGTTTERVGRYQLLEPIGIGPTGTVSRAKVFGVAGFERQFAIKRFHGELTAEVATAQALSAAARAYGGLEHPRIARMSEFGVAQGTTFTAVELVPGLDALRLIAEARLASTTLAAGGALALVSQAARAVGYAHGRGLTHLGLSPTNVIVTAEGDVKITDFGILSATLPQRPIDVVRLAHRIQYLAPEQLANEATSAATDVFALGVLAYELVTGQRTFRGDTPQQVAQSVMTGPSAEPPLPRPLVRVLQRCLVRSPFERFPDARALADALDAALRVAPVPGTRKDIGAQVKQTLERLAELHSGELSGLVAFNFGPINLGNAAPIPTLGRESQPEREFATTEFVRPDTHVPGPAPLVSLRAAEETARDLPQHFSTVAGLAPPPIPVPQGVSSPSAPTPPRTPSTPSMPSTPSTLLGIQNTPRPEGRPGRPPAIPPTLPRQTGTPARPIATPELPLDRPSETAVSPLRISPAHATVAQVPALPRTSSASSPPELASQLYGALRPSSDAAEHARTDLVIETDPGSWDPSDRSATESDLAAGRTRTDQGLGVAEARRETEEMSPLLAGKLNAAARKPTEEIAPLVAEAWRAEAMAEFPHEQHVAAPPAEPAAASAKNEHHIDTVGVRVVPQRRDRAPRILTGILAAVTLVAGALVVRDLMSDAGTQPAKVASVTPDAPRDVPADATLLAVVPADGKARGADAAMASAPADAAVVASVPVDAPKAVDAAVAAPGDASKPGAASDSLTLTSRPAGARVFINGSDAGVTPLELPSTLDKLTVALVLPGHELYLANVDGHGAFAIPLKAVTPTNGPAGIKVLKCAKDRYYVYVDGKPTGQSCPTERIGVEIGPHVVEVYDVISETRRKWEIDVKDTRLSYRVKID